MREDAVQTRALTRLMMPSLPSSDVVAKHAAIDRKRVYATGMSNGGFMTNRWLAKSTMFFAAFAPVSGLYKHQPRLGL